MKIISQPDPTWSYKFACKKCAAQLEAEASDLKYNYYAGDQREPSYETFSLQCPICSYTMAIDKHSIPRIVRINIQTKNGRIVSSLD